MKPLASYQLGQLLPQKGYQNDHYAIFSRVHRCATSADKLDRSSPSDWLCADNHKSTFLIVTTGGLSMTKAFSLEAGAKRIRQLIEEQQRYESDSEEFEAINLEISGIVIESDQRLAWVVDAAERVIH